MNKTYKSLICLLFLVLMNISVKAQMAGVFNIPGDFPTVAAATSSLNSVGVSGPVIINIPAGYSETLTAVVSLSATGTSANPITFQKSGVGANPVLVAYSGGVGTPATAVQDGLFRLVGSDYITIDGLDLFDPNGSNPATMEYGYGLFKASATDGCQNVTIKNCNITLNRVNNATGTAPAVDGSRGIDVVNALPNAHTTAVIVTSSTGANSNNMLYSNTIQNCNIGIALIGYAAASPFTNADTGNDVGGSSVATGNTIINYGGAAAATNPAVAIRTLAQYNFNASYNTINNNTGAGANHPNLIRGIYLNTATSANATVSSNTISINGGGTTSQMSCIENASGSTAASNTISIVNNVVSNCTYTTMTSATVYGIYNSASAANVYINGNSISGFTLNPAGSTGSVYFIYNSSTVGSALSISSNTVQNIANLNTSGSIYAMYGSNSTNNYTVQANVVNNVSRGATLGGTMYGFYNFGSPSSGTAYVLNNSFTNIGVGGGANTFYGIYQATSTSQTEVVNNNVVSAVSGTNSTIYGIYHSYGAAGSTLSNNSVSNLSGGSTVYGLYFGSTAPVGMTVASNTVNTLSSTGASVVNGVYCSGGTNTSMYKNKIYDLMSNNASGSVVGINVPSSTSTATLNIYNNLIGDLRAPVTSNATSAVIGINITSAATNANFNVYFNSIYINATSTGTNFGTSGIFHTANATATTSKLTLIDNVIVNLSTPMGTGITAAMRSSSTALGNYSTSSNNNLFYAGTPSASNLLYYDGTNSYQTMGTFKAAVSPRELSSVTENPPFISVSGPASNFLNINPAIPTQIESGGIPVSGITDDFAGTLRNVSNPDLGAWEGNYTFADNTAPAISAIGFASSACSLSARTVTANISDASGTATGALAPRAYYKVNSNPYTSVQGTLISGTVNNGVWSFNLSFTASLSDVISYYIVAQDVASSPNLGANPSAGFAGSDVNTVTSPPTTPLTYTIASSLSGLYTVGATGTFTTLTAAANAYNTSCLTGPVTFQLIDPSYSTAETYPITFMNNTDASSTNSLLIVPNTGVAASITGTSTAVAVIKFLNARFITVDGVNSGGTSLTINNTSTGTSANIWAASTASTTTGCNTISLKNMILNGGSNTATQFGIVAGTDGALPSVTGGADNDNFTITGNTILRNYYGIYASGTASLTAGGLDNWSVASNTIGPVTSGTNSIGFAGIYVQNMLNLAITSNLVQNVITASSANGGIYLVSGVNAASVKQNTVTMITTTSTGSGTSSTSGIFFGTNVINSSISQNVVSSIYNTNTGGWGARGIMLATGVAASNDVVQNNMVSDIVSYTDPSASYWPIGIALESASGGINIDNNSVSLTGSHPGLTSGTGSADLYVNTGSTAGLKIRDNVFSNTFDNSSSTTDIAYSIYSTSSIGSFAVIDYNNYYVGGAASSLILGYLGGNQATLPAIQASFGGNVNSTNVTPVFTSVTDLHLVPASNVALDNTGTPIAGITVDIDGQTRSATTPDMGADEFAAPVCTAANPGTQSTATFSACNGSTLSLISSGASTGIGISYQWMVSSTPSGPYSNVTGGSGATTVSYTTATLSTGVYYFVLQTTCSSASLTGTSNEATVTINAIPTASASNNSPICSGQNLSLTGGSDIATNYTWIGPNSFSATTQNPSIPGVSTAATGVYTLIASTPNCTSTPVTSSVTINATPTAMTVTPASAAFCVGGSQTVSVSGGFVPVTLNAGTNTNTNTATTYPSPYTMYWGGQRMQFLVLASELSAAGFVTNSPLNSIQFPVVSMGSNWGSTTTANLNFQVSVGMSTITALTAFQSGLTNVVAPMNFTPAVGYGNAHNFSAPFVWDGVSNVIFETTFSNQVVGTINDAVFTYTTPTTFTSTIVYRADNTAAAVIAAGTTVNEGPFMARPDFKLNGLSIGTYSWSPTTSLSSSTGPTVTATPTTSTVYSVTVVNGSCSSSASISMSVAPVPTVSIAASNTFVCNPSTATLTASGATSYTWSTFSNSASIVVSPSVATTYTVRGSNGLCASSKTVSIAAGTIPTVSVASTSSLLCTGQTATITASGSAASYSWSSGGSGSSITVTPSLTTTYSVTATNTVGCTNTVAFTQSVSTCTGLEESAYAGDIMMYPNPNSGNVNVVISRDMTASAILEVYDAIGKLVIRQRLTAEINPISTIHLDNGMYMFKVSMGDKTIKIGRMIKQ